MEKLNESISNLTSNTYSFTRSDCELVLTSHEKKVTGVALSHLYDEVFSCSKDNSIKRWDVEYGQLAHTMMTPDSYPKHHPRSIACHETNDTIVSAHRDKVIRRWDNRSIGCVQELEGHQNTVSSIALDGDKIISGAHDCSIRIWDTRMAKCITALGADANELKEFHDKNIPHTHDYRVNSLTVDNKQIIAAYGKEIHIWSLETGKCNQMLKGHNEKIKSVCATENTIVSGSKDGSINVWNRKTGKHLYTNRWHTESVNAMVLNGKNVISGSTDNTIRIWELESGYEEMHFSTLSHNGGPEDFFEDPTEEPMMTPAEWQIQYANRVHSVDFHNKVLAAGIQTGSILIWKNIS